MLHTDGGIKRNIEHELEWDPDIDATDVGVTVKDRVVFLTGVVHSYMEKLAAQRDAKRIVGVLGIANDISVELPGTRISDAELARNAVAALQQQMPELADAILLTVEDGHLGLTGTLEWHHLKQRAADTVSCLKGVKGVMNHITVCPKVAPSQVKFQIEQALKRSAEVDAKQIEVQADGGDITLNGNVRAWIEREAAERAAWLAPGVVNVRNHLTVQA